MAVQLTEQNTLKKEDIIFYLYNYISILSLSTNNTNISFRNINKYLMENKFGNPIMSNSIYFYSLRIYEFMLLKQIYSYKYDSIFPDLKEDEIDNITFPNNLFVNPDDERRFSKKQTIKYIRNAINHNNSDRELYHIVQDHNRLILDINLLNTKPIPFHVQLDIRDLMNLEKAFNMSEFNPDITLVIHKSAIDYSNPNFMQELDKVAIRRYNFNASDMKNNREIVKNLSLNGHININELSQLGTSDADFVDYDLSLSQKTKIMQDINEFTSKCHMSLNDQLLSYIVNGISQFGSTKIYNLSMDYFFCDHYLGRRDKCLIDFQNDVIEYYENPNGNNYLKNYINRISDFDFMFYRAWDFDQLINNAVNVLSSYLLDTYIKDENVNIADKTINTEKIRDSFVHGRFYIGNNSKYRLFDSFNGRKNESNINWKETIRYSDLLKFVMSTIDPIVKDYRINIPMTYFPQPNKFFSMITEGTTFITLLDDNSFTDMIKDSKYKIIKIENKNIVNASQEEKEEFINQLNHLPDDIKAECEKEIEKVIEYNIQTYDKNKLK